MLHLVTSIDIKRNRPLIGPVYLPLLTVVIILPTAIKTHFGAVSGASVLISPRIQRNGCKQG